MYEAYNVLKEILFFQEAPQYNYVVEMVYNIHKNKYIFLSFYDTYKIYITCL